MHLGAAIGLAGAAALLLFGGGGSASEASPFPFVPAASFAPGRSAALRLVVLHSTEGGTAKTVSEMFAAGGKPSRSAHYVVDRAATIQCVREADTAYAAPGANADGLQIEICGWAKWTEAEWHASGVLPRVVELLRRLCLAHGLPVAHVDVAGLKSGARGVTTHGEVTQAFGRSTHWDPGPGFPLAWVLQQAGGAQGAAVVPGSPPSPRPAGGALPGPAVSPASPRLTGRVVLAGDSLAVGLAGPLGKLLGDVDGIGKNSTTIDHWAGALALDQALATKPRLVLVSLGTNDIAAADNANAKRPKIAAIVDKVRAARAAIGWVLPPSLPWPGYGVRAALAQELSARNVPAFDSEALAFERAPDGVHATPAGYAAWAAAIAAWVKASGL